MNANHMNLTIFKIAKEFDKSVLFVKYMVTCRNILYKAVSIKNKSFVIRLTDQQIRSKEQLEGELHFQDYLFRNGANVTRPLKTVKNEWVSECIVDDKKYYVSAFTFAKGLNWYERDDKNPETFYQIGKALGKVHKLSKNYEVTSYKRRKWYEQQELANAPELFKDYSMELYNSFMSFVDEMKAIKNSQDNYGLTHGDFLMSNYLINQDKVTIIDFDECEYSWYAMDLAICIRNYLVGDEPERIHKKTDLSEMIYYNLLLGYQTENSITDDMICDLNKYIYVRDYIEISQMLNLIKQGRTLCDVENRLLKADIDRVLNGKPFLKIDFNKLSNSFNNNQ